MKDKPKGVIFVSVVLMVFGLLALRAFLIGLYHSLRLKTLLFFPALRLNLSVWAVPAVAALFAVYAWGVFRLKEWARRGAVILSWLLILLYNVILLDTIFGRFESIFKVIILKECILIVFTIIMLLYVIYFLTLPDIKRRFI